MKNIIYIILALPFLCAAQKTEVKDSTISKADSLKLAISRKCYVRGHLSSGWSTTTAAYCGTFTDDTECHTKITGGGCNTTTYKCARCGRFINEKDPRYSYYVWKSENCKHE
mgnify:CR=1 FL=1